MNAILVTSTISFFLGMVTMLVIMVIIIYQAGKDSQPKELPW